MELIERMVKLELARFVDPPDRYPDGSAIWITQGGKWQGSFKPKAGILRTSRQLRMRNEDGSVSDFPTKEAAALALADAGEGPASVPGWSEELHKTLAEVVGHQTAGRLGSKPTAPPAKPAVPPIPKHCSYCGAALVALGCDWVGTVREGGEVIVRMTCVRRANLEVAEESAGCGQTIKYRCLRSMVSGSLTVGERSMLMVPDSPLAFNGFEFEVKKIVAKPIEIEKCVRPLRIFPSMFVSGDPSVERRYFSVDSCDIPNDAEFVGASADNMCTYMIAYFRHPSFAGSEGKLLDGPRYSSHHPGAIVGDWVKGRASAPGVRRLEVDMFGIDPTKLYRIESDLIANSRVVSSYVEAGRLIVFVESNGYIGKEKEPLNGTRFFEVEPNPTLSLRMLAAGWKVSPLPRGRVQWTDPNGSDGPDEEAYQSSSLDHPPPEAVDTFLVNS